MEGMRTLIIGGKITVNHWRIKFTVSHCNTVVPGCLLGNQHGATGTYGIY